ncbi:MAG: CoA ester lyase [Bradyrhizobiaceae bacterium]|nr:MAG: CoA ester lyase [Bradyrhizobiaceae bacterium]
MIRPRRSPLFMPGSNARAIEKARTLAADVVILDLEDSIAPDAKQLAREQIAREMAKGGFGRRELVIRVNHLKSPWWQDDFAMAVKARPDGILVPKILGPEDLTTIARKLDELGADPALRVWVMIETPLAVVNIAAIAARALDRATRLEAFVIGPNDIALETRMRMLPGRAAMVPIFTSIIVAARAYGVEMLDGPYSDFSNATGFAEECAQARDLGFDGKTLIHPSQIETANAVFTPAADELARAREIIAAFTLPENAGKGAINLKGQMVERLHAEMARRVIAISEAIAG